MLITRWIDYGVRIMVTLALSPDEWLSASELSKTCNITRPATLRLIRQLAMAKLVVTRRGPGGGVKLGKKIEDVSFHDVVEATDSRRAVNPCLIEDHFCERAPSCAVHDLLDPLQKYIDDFFRDLKLSDIVKAQKEKLK